jgi:transposase-like protein
MESNSTPQTLLEAVRYFSDPDTCLNFVAELRWPDGPACPKCQGKELSFLSTRRLWKCKACKKQFSVKVGTIFEDSALGLDKWLAAIWLIANAKNGISSWELHRAIGITQKSAWHMLHRIRLAMQTGSFAKLRGDVESDETFIGGKSKFMHASKRAGRIQGRGPVGKTVVQGMLERGGQVHVKVVADQRKGTLQDNVREHVLPGSSVFTDTLRSYEGLDDAYVHGMVDHSAGQYVDGKVHTNGLENFWSLVKRCLKGTYVAVAPWHLFRYLDEEAFRFNHRGGKDGDKEDGKRFLTVLSRIFGRRLTYRGLIGKLATAG